MFPHDGSLILPRISILLGSPTLHTPTASPRSVLPPMGLQPQLHMNLTRRSYEVSDTTPQIVMSSIQSIIFFLSTPAPPRDSS